MVTSPKKAAVSAQSLAACGASAVGSSGSAVGAGGERGFFRRGGGLRGGGIERRGDGGLRWGGCGWCGGLDMGVGSAGGTVAVVRVAGALPDGAQPAIRTVTHRVVMPITNSFIFMSAFFDPTFHKLVQIRGSCFIIAILTCFPTLTART